MNIIKTFSIAVAATATLSATAQNLSKEIEVEHQVVIDHYDASRMALKPRIVLPALTTKPLQYSERSVNVKIQPEITYLEPTAYADTLETSPYNGYAVLGYLPIYNLAASAGYRFIDNDRIRLNAWMQFDGSSYEDSRTVDPMLNRRYDSSIYRNTLTVGANFHTMVGRKSEIDAGIDYTFARFNAPGAQVASSGILHNDLYNQSVNRLNASAQWMSAVGGLSYTAGIDYSYFGYRNGFENTLLWPEFDSGELHLTEADRPVHENVFRFNGAGALALSDISSAYLGINLDVVNDSRRSYLDKVNDGDFRYILRNYGGSYNHGILSLLPRYRVKTDNFSLMLGASVQLSFHAGKVIHVTPDVNVSWTPVSFFTIWGRYRGGDRQNTLSSLYDVNYMTAPMIAYKNSYVPLDLEGGIIAGPFRGAYAELYGGYAVANEWLMPIGFPAQGYAPVMFRDIDMRGWHMGLKLGYKYRNWADARVSAEAAPQAFDRGYYLWRDRAKYVMKAEVTSHPIDRLDVGVSYELRACRAMIDRSLLLSPTDIHYNFIRYRLGNVSNLGVSGAWHFSKQLSVFLEIENLLNHRATTLGLVEDMGIHGLAGVSYKF